MLLWLLACAGPAPVVDSTAPGDDSLPVEEDSAPTRRDVRVRVTLDGVPTAGVTVMQGGEPERYTTDAAGEVVVSVDLTGDADIALLAAHPEARTVAELVYDRDEVELPLERFDPSDNEAYVFADPGEGEPLGASSSECLHCHLTAHAAWWASPHRTSASNPAVQDVYQGTAVALDAAACATVGGTWGAAVEPGTLEGVERCFVDVGVSATGGHGACADCHAPGIDGALGGRDLLDAVGTAYDDGVHCDVCHRVESVDLAAEPGVAGRLRLVRPSEPSTNPAFGAWTPLTFGPWDDVPNPRMGGVARALYHQADHCAGCHEHEQPVWLGAADPARWPDGRLPVQSTYTEWLDSPQAPDTPCQACHMPPDPTVASGADLYADHNDGKGSVGIATGWERPPGSVRQHAFWGPRQPEGGMLGLAATVDVATAVEGEELVASVTVTNVGPGHALPTGEPMRALLLVVSATCDGAPVPAVGGDVLPAFAGAVEERLAGEDWTRWPAAEVGDVLRVTRWTGAWVDYAGFGPFGDGTFDAAAKGLPGEAMVGEATVVAVDGAGGVTLDRPLPTGDRVRLGRGQALAGAPGWAFARVLVDADGREMVPHFLAVDVTRDNRLLPGAAWTSVHRFAPDCADPEVRATLLHRDRPWALAAQRGWTVTDQGMAEVRR